MARVLRFLTLLASFAALQLTLASGGPGCPMPSAASAAETHGGGMAGMTMAGMDTPAMDLADGGAPATSSSGRAADDVPPASDSVPCDESGAPVTCPTMAPCAFAALPPLAQVAAARAVAAPAGPAALRVLMPPSVSAAPELPPPRA